MANFDDKKVQDKNQQEHPPVVVPKYKESLKLANNESVRPEERQSRFQVLQGEKKETQQAIGKQQIEESKVVPQQNEEGDLKQQPNKKSTMKKPQKPIPQIMIEGAGASNEGPSSPLHASNKRKQQGVNPEGGPTGNNLSIKIPVPLESMQESVRVQMKKSGDGANVGTSIDDLFNLVDENVPDCVRGIK